MTIVFVATRHHAEFLHEVNAPGERGVGPVCHPARFICMSCVWGGGSGSLVMSFVFS